MSSGVVFTARWAHPRVCGENHADYLRPRGRFGSSPRVRGKRLDAPSNTIRARLIPACAGKTGRPGKQSRSTRAHPRVCGENTIEIADSLREFGSSPRVRGKRAVPCRLTVWPRLIPACAGKTSHRHTLAASSRAHPRVCGENLQPQDISSCTQGSSPRVRGKLGWCVVRAPANGLIPACAGKTLLLLNSKPRNRAHPRVCGENTGP